MGNEKEIVVAISKKRFTLSTEKDIQAEMMDLLTSKLDTSIQREFHFDDKNIIDFFIDNSIGIEVKIKGNRKDIYRQCVRYCKFESLKVLILATTAAMGMPSIINNKPIIIINLSKAWL